MKSTTLIGAVTVLVIGSFILSAHAATTPLFKSECKQIQASGSVTDNVMEDLIRGVSGKIIEYYNWFFRPKSLSGGGAGESRTFGRPIRKLKNALIPLMFWMGIVFSMIKFIMFLSLKSVAIGMTILTLNVAFIASKIALFFKGGHGGGDHGGWGGGKDVHVHVHPTQGAELIKPLGGWADRSTSASYKNSYYVTEDGQSIAYHTWPQAMQAIQGKGNVGAEDNIKKRSTTDEVITYEYELPHQMGVAPPTPNVANIKNRRTMKV